MISLAGVVPVLQVVRTWEGVLTRQKVAANTIEVSARAVLKAPLVVPQDGRNMAGHSATLCAAGKSAPRITEGHVEKLAAVITSIAHMAWKKKVMLEGMRALLIQACVVRTVVDSATITLVHRGMKRNPTPAA